MGERGLVTVVRILDFDIVIDLLLLVGWLLLYLLRHALLRGGRGIRGHEDRRTRAAAGGGGGGGAV